MPAQPGGPDRRRRDPTRPELRRLAQVVAPGPIRHHSVVGSAPHHDRRGLAPAARRAGRGRRAQRRAAATTASTVAGPGCSSSSTATSIPIRRLVSQLLDRCPDAGISRDVDLHQRVARPASGGRGRRLPARPRRHAPRCGAPTPRSRPQAVELGRGPLRRRRPGRPRPRAGARRLGRQRHDRHPPHRAAADRPRRGATRRRVGRRAVVDRTGPTGSSTRSGCPPTACSTSTWSRTVPTRSSAAPRAPARASCCSRWSRRSSRSIRRPASTSCSSTTRAAPPRRCSGTCPTPSGYVTNLTRTSPCGR